MFSGIQKLKESITSRSILHENVKRSLLAKNKLHQIKTGFTQRNEEHQKWQLPG